MVIIDLLAGIGGLERALQHAKPWFVVAVESDPRLSAMLEKVPGAGAVLGHPED